MIYLSGGINLKWLGKRPDLGIMVTYMPKRSRIAKADLRSSLNVGLWAADNGCFTNPDLDIKDYMRWLELHSVGLNTCLFATAPDVVGDAVLTVERSRPVLPQIRALGYKAAFVAQDGMESRKVDWDSFDVLFIGGSTKWKLSGGAYWLIQQAKRQGKKVHLGRCNSWTRLRYAKLAGCDSADGTHLVFKPDARLAELYTWLDRLQSRYGGNAYAWAQSN